MKDIQYLQKDDEVGFGSSKYRAMSEEKVTATVRESLIKNGLVIIPIEQTHSRTDTLVTNDKGKEQVQRLSTVDVRYKIVDVETGESIEAVSSGTGVDTQDKGVGKAMTYAYKYLLLRTFAIPTGEDPDKISSAEWDSKVTGDPKQASQGKPSTTTTNQPQKANNPSYQCEICGQIITAAVNTFSMNKYKKPLCQGCQKKAS